MRTWGHLPGKDFTAVRLSLIERSKTAESPSVLGMRDFELMSLIYHVWTFMDPVPSSFLSPDSDQTMVEEDESSESKSHSGSDSDSDSDSDSSASSMEWEVRSAADPEPKRRLFPSEIEQDFDYGNDDDAISCDSHITGVEDPDDFAKASIERGDYEEDQAWLKGMASWAEGAKDARDAQSLLNDDQIVDDPRERPRIARTLDLDKPDYLSRHGNRT